jgi:hypothetical protein
MARSAAWPTTDFLEKLTKTDCDGRMLMGRYWSPRDSFYPTSREGLRGSRRGGVLSLFSRNEPEQQGWQLTQSAAH